MNYYQRLRDVREDYDLKQEDIAKILGINQTQYSRYELGKNMMGIDKYITLAKFYNISIDYLAGIVDKPKTISGAPYSTVNKNITITNNGDGYKINIKNQLQFYTLTMN